jgi:hypothetical protein
LEAVELLEEELRLPREGAGDTGEEDAEITGVESSSCPGELVRLLR